MFTTQPSVGEEVQIQENCLPPGTVLVITGSGGQLVTTTNHTFRRLSRSRNSKPAAHLQLWWIKLPVNKIFYLRLVTGTVSIRRTAEHYITTQLSLLPSLLCQLMSSQSVSYYNSLLLVRGTFSKFNNISDVIQLIKLPHSTHYHYLTFIQPLFDAEHEQG